ncbi:MAG: hypothetical protein V1735_00715 [Nanoarchaeota archaeon]
MNNRALLAGISAGIVYFIITAVFNLGARPYLAWTFFKQQGFWWYALKLLFDLITGIVMAFVYHFVVHSIPGLHWNRGFTYGFFIWLLADVPMAFFLYLMFNLPGFILLLWLVAGFFARLFMGFTIAHFIVKKHSHES